MIITHHHAHGTCTWPVGCDDDDDDDNDDDDDDGSAKRRAASTMLRALLLATLAAVRTIAAPDDCSLAASSTARQLLQSNFFGWLESDFGITKAHLNAQCPLLPENDYHAAHEAFKLRWGNRVKCTCGKVFKNDFFADRHVAGRHRPQPNALGFCLERVCDFMPCNAADHDFRPSQRGAHACRNLLNKCLPRGASQAHDALEAVLCAGKLRPVPASSALKVLTWLLLAAVGMWYAAAWWSARAARGRGSALPKVKRVPAPPPLATPPPAPRRQQVSREQQLL